jgi:ribosomal protein S19
MDGLIATIIGGVVVTAIGAILAFYFGGVRERQKREYERQQEEQRRLEERQEEEQKREAEKQEELNKRRAEALAQIQAQASAVVENVKSWGANATVLPEFVRAIIEATGGYIRRVFDPRLARMNSAKGVRQLLLQYSEVVQQRDSIAAQMESLNLYYREQAPTLPHTARRLIESFDKDFDGRYNALSSQLVSYPSFRQRFMMREDLPADAKVVDTLMNTVPALGVIDSGLTALGGNNTLLDSLKSLQEEWAGLPDAAS